MTNIIWLIGAGYMAKEYVKVLKKLENNFIVVGRSEIQAASFTQETEIEVLTGGLEKFLATKPQLPKAVIVAVGIEGLSNCTKLLLDYGVKKILLEKPGVGYASEIDELAELASFKKADVLLAYNRRFYSSVLKAREIIKEDGGVTSFNFEFTEWSHVIRTLTKHEAEHHNWFLGNSTHIIDTAFFLGGKPKELCSFVKGGTDWHPKSSIYSGAGESKTGALFSYHANWEAPGRWVIEILTAKSRLIFKPIETLQIQQIGSVAINQVEINDQLDKDFKPGLFLQTKSFLEGDYIDFCSILEQRNSMRYYLKMSGY